MPEQWQLLQESRVAAGLLRLHVCHPAHYVAGTEPKAAQTADLRFPDLVQIDLRAETVSCLTH